MNQANNYTTDIIALTPANWASYQLIDCGNFMKLESFNGIVTIRPEPQAVWPPSLSFDAWQDKAAAWFKKDKGSTEKGEWHVKDGIPEVWFLPYVCNGHNIKLKLSLSSFKHVGVFPEQAANWDYIVDAVKQLGAGCKVLNMFAYTGGATLAAKAAGAEVTHLDAVKQVVNWAKENIELSGLPSARYIVDDALAFAKREVRRGNIYQGIILDPPAYGRGPNGEKWVLEENIMELLEVCSQIIDKDNGFVVVNLYSLGFSALISQNLMRAYFPNQDKAEFGELYLDDSFNKKLPLGTFYRYLNIKK